MTFKSVTWYRIAVVLGVANLAGGWFAAAAAEPLHATTHAALAVAFALLAQRLRRRARENEQEEGQNEIEGSESLEVLKNELQTLRMELSETQERLDFTERVLAKRPESPRVDPPRQDR
jgi:hypothetical protein